MQLYKDNLGKVSITVEQGYWDINKDYDKLVVVEKEGTFGTYISRKPVPAGTVLTDRTYWIPFSSLKEEIVIDYNNFIDRYSTILEDHEVRITNVEALKDSVENLILNTDALIDDTNELLIQVRTDIETANATLDKAKDLINTFEESKNEIEGIAQDAKNTVDTLVETKGEPNGLATLDDSGKLNITQLPFENTIRNIPNKILTTVYHNPSTETDYVLLVNRYKNLDQGTVDEATFTIPSATETQTGAMQYNDKRKLKTIPDKILTYPDLNQTTTIETTDTGTNIKIFANSVATIGSDNRYSITKNQPILLPKFKFGVNKSGLIDEAYAKYLTNMIYQHKEAGTIATANFNISAKKIEFNTSSVVPTFSDDNSTITDSTIVTKTTTIPIATKTNIGLLSTTYAKYLDSLSDGYVEVAYLDDRTNKIYADKVHFGEGATFQIDLTPANATSTLNGLMSSEDKVKLDKIAVANNTLPQSIVSSVDINQDNIIDVMVYEYDAETGEYNNENGGYTVKPNNATTEMDGYMSKEDKANLDKAIEDIETKANISDLSNVLAEEVADSTTLEGIDTFTREEAKKDLFIDMWNQACGNCSRYNDSTGYFELNGLTDITYEQALDIYNAPRISYPNVVGFQSINCRTLIKSSVELSRASLDFTNKFTNGMYETLELGSIYIHAIISAFENCQKLKTVIGDLIFYKINNTVNAFRGCYTLESVKINTLETNIRFADSPLLSLESFQYMITNAVNSSPISITVHPDVYAKLTDTANTEWNKVLTDAAAKQISFVSA